MDLRKNTRFTRFVLTASLVVIIISLLLFIIFGLRSFNLIRLPKFIENIFYRTDETEVVSRSDDSSLYRYLREKGIVEADSAGEAVSAELDPEKLREVVSGFYFADCVWLECSAMHYSGGAAAREERISVWKLGDKVRYLFSADNGLNYLCVNDTKKQQTEDLVTGKAVTTSVNSPLALDRVPGLVSLSAYLAPDDGTTVISCLTGYEDEENIVTITLSTPALGLTEKVVFSLETGIVMEAESVDSTGMLVYRYTVSVKEAYYSDQRISGTQITDELFRIR